MYRFSYIPSMSICRTFTIIDIDMVWFTIFLLDNGEKATHSRKSTSDLDRGSFPGLATYKIPFWCRAGGSAYSSQSQRHKGKELATILYPDKHSPFQFQETTYNIQHFVIK